MTNFMDYLSAFFEWALPLAERFTGPHALDIFIGIVLGLAFIVGLFKPWRTTLMSLLVQWGCLGIAFLAGRLLSNPLAGIVMGIDSVRGFFDFIPAAQLQQLVSSVFILVAGILIYALFGSILFTLSKNRGWELMIFPERELPTGASRPLSGVFSFLHAYTYVFFFLALLSLPMFNVIEEGSLASRAVEYNRVGDMILGTVTDPFVELYETVNIIETELSDIVVGGSIQFDVVADIINNEPEQLEEITQSLQAHFPELFTDEMVSQMEQFVEQDMVSPEEVREFIHSHLNMP